MGEAVVLSEGGPLQWHRSVWNSLLGQLQEDRLPHAMMFSGLPGVGKREVARRWAARLLCDCQGPTACGECKSCRLLQAGNHPDLRFLMPEEESRQIKIDQVRELVDYLGKTPQISRRKVVVVWPLEQLNLSAANAFLKSLEEPPANTHMVLVADSLRSVLPTIRSRCQILRCNLPGRESAFAWLADQGVDAGEASSLLDICDGRPMAALALCQSGAMRLRQRLLSDVLQLGNQQVEASALASQWAKEDVAGVVFWLQAWFRDLARFVAVPSRKVLHNKDIDVLIRSAVALRAKDVHGILDLLGARMSALMMGANPNKQLMLENLFYNIGRCLMGLPINIPVL